MIEPSARSHPTLAPDRLSALVAVLDKAKQLGFLGPGPVQAHIDRALPILPLLPEDCAHALDLGSGGGVPGLVLAMAKPTVEWTLLEGSTTRSRFLHEAIGLLELTPRVLVVAQRAEDAARSSLRGSFDAVTARSFGAPAVTAECGAPFLRLGGKLIVAEPPGGIPSRWPRSNLAQVGLALGASIESPSAFQVLIQVETCPERFPRRTGVPAKRPLF